MRFTVFQILDPLPAGSSVSDMHYTEGSAIDCAKALLRQCTLTELHALKLHGLLLIQREVAERTGEACRQKVATEIAARTGVVTPEPTDEWAAFGAPPDDQVALTGLVPPEAIDPLADDDEPVRPTQHHSKWWTRIRVSGRRATESHGGPVS